MIRLGEYAFGMVCLAISGFGAISKIWHRPSWSVSVKTAMTAITVAVVVVLGIITIDVKGDAPWSHLLPDKAVQVFVQLLPCCRNAGEPEIKDVSGAAITISNLSERTIRHDVSVQLSLPQIKSVTVDDPTRVKIIQEVLGVKGHNLHLFANDLAPQESHFVMVALKGLTPFISVDDWQKMAKYPSNVVLVGPGLFVTGPAMINPRGPAAPPSCRACHLR